MRHNIWDISKKIIFLRFFRRTPDDDLFRSKHVAFKGKKTKCCFRRNSLYLYDYMFTARWIPLNLHQNSPVQLTTMFRVTQELITVYCSCPGVLLLKARLLYAFFNMGGKNVFGPHIVFMYLKLFYEKAAIICLKLGDWFFVYKSLVPTCCILS